MNWFASLELWQKILCSNVVFAFLGAVAVYFWLNPFDWVTDLYLGIVIAGCVTTTVVGVVERRLRGEKILGQRGQKRQHEDHLI